MKPVGPVRVQPSFGLNVAQAEAAGSDASSPIAQLLYFHKGIRGELEEFHRRAVALTQESREDSVALLKRFRFFKAIYKYHCSAEDEVVFPALDSRVKNVAHAYTLEHKIESDLFDQLSGVMSTIESRDVVDVELMAQLTCCSEALLTVLVHHLEKEEEQVFPLLLRHFSLQEQANIVWKFLCSIPVKLMAQCLPWIASYLSDSEQEDMAYHMNVVVPKEGLLRQVVSAWMSKIPGLDKHWQALDRVGKFSASQAGQRDISTAGTPSSCEICSGLKLYPIDEIVHWHKALRDELGVFREQALCLSKFADNDAALLQFEEKFRFLADICLFHSAAEDEILFPALVAKGKQETSLSAVHADEERRFVHIGELLSQAHALEKDEEGRKKLLEEVCSESCILASSILDHLQMEEQMVLPQIRRLCTVDEQRALVFQCLLVMPLRLLEVALPWLTTSMSSEEAQTMLENMNLAAPEVDGALVKLFKTWARRPERPKRQVSIVEGQEEDEDSSCLKSQPFKRMRYLPALRLTGSEGSGELGADQAGLAPKESPGGSGMSSAERFLRSGSTLGPNIFSTNKPKDSTRSRPIDAIFTFHQALRKDLDHLCEESRRLGDCSEEALREFSGKFHFLWGLYRAHSNSEDDIVFPALEAKEALHNVSHSYSIDHKQEEELFNDIAAVLAQLASTVCAISKLQHSHYGVQHESGSSSSAPELISMLEKRKELSAKAQRMALSVRLSLDQHISREEVELWPLFGTHFTIEEQDKIVGRIIGTTGAEVLQAMLTWITAALSDEERISMMTTWRNATRNTMFDEWLRNWWNQSPLVAVQRNESETQDQGKDLPGSDQDGLQMVADYLRSSGCEAVATREEKGGIEARAMGDCSAAVGSCAAPAEEGSHAEAGCGPPPQLCQERESGDDTFRSGWHNIFRMNQKELEAAIRKVSRDPSLDPRRKAYLMQNLMTSRWIVAQQKGTEVFGVEDKVPEEDQKPCYSNVEAKLLGCEHYERNCKVRAPCCGKFFACHFCHDKVSDHTMERQKVKEMMCMSCFEVQPVGQHCATPSCNGMSMARYYCSICKLFDNSRDIYHCPFCNLCRVGKGLGVDYFHCMTCNSCMSMSLSSHKCREKGLEANCPICHDFLFTSSSPVRSLPCGHFMHSSCFQAYTFEHYTCPICSKSVGDMSVYFGMLDALLAAEQLPEEYRGRRQDILCNDCGVRGDAAFHWLYHKCQSCGSYNTRTT